MPSLLATWLVDALLLNEIPSALIITGNGRHEAAGKIRNFIDPMASAVHGMPISKQAMGRLAITNRVMAFGAGKNISQAKIDQLNQLRTGMLVELKQVGRNNETITELIRRPIIVTAEQALHIHDGQIEIEINKLATVERSEILAAILNAAVTQIRGLQEQEERQVYLERAAPEIPISPPPELGEKEGPCP